MAKIITLGEIMLRLSPVGNDRFIQYRSIPVIGDIVSQFAYNGMVKTFIQRAPQKQLHCDGMD